MIFITLKEVFSQIRYTILALIIASATFIFSTWLPNLRLILQVITSSTATVIEKLNILLSLIASIRTNFAIFSAFYTTIIAALFGINSAMLLFHLRQRKTFLQQTHVTTNFVGLISGMFGIGCTSCGTIILGPLLSLFGAGGLIALLPLKGGEFGVLSIIILASSIFLMAKKIQEPPACGIKHIFPVQPARKGVNK